MSTRRFEAFPTLIKTLERKGIVFLSLIVFVALPALLMAQSGTSYKVESGVLNAGGNPSPALASTSFKMSLDAIGDAAAATGLASASYKSDCGFPPGYAPCGEVLNQHFIDKVTQTWDPDHAGVTYNLYQGQIADLRAGSYGLCQRSGITNFLYRDVISLNPGQCFFYLVTAENGLGEEGTLGSSSSGSQRPNTGACP